LVTFFVLFYLYVWLRVETHLIYDGLGLTRSFPIFVRDLGFFKKFLRYPGGPVEYLAALLSQYYYYSWLGALIITVLAALGFLAGNRFFKLVGGRHFRVLSLVPALLLLAICSRYGNPLLTGLGLLAALAAANLYVRVKLSGWFPRGAVFLALAALVYYAAGGAYLLFAPLCGVFELALRRHWMGLLHLVATALLPYIAGGFIFVIRLSDAYWRLLPFYSRTDPRGAVLALILYLFFPIAALLIALRHKLVPFVLGFQRGLVLLQMVLLGRAKSSGPRSAGNVRSVRRNRLVEHFGKSRLRWAARLFLFMVIAGAGLHVTFNGNLKRRLEIDYLASQQTWGRLLEKARQLPIDQYDFRVAWNVNRALYHLGKLPYEMFSYPQEPGSLLPSPGDFPIGEEALVDLTDVLIELGSANEAERSGCEALNVLGDRPQILQKLVLIHLAKGQLSEGHLQAARIYLGALSKDLIYGQWARDYLQRLKLDPTLSTDQTVQKVRARSPKRDYITDLKAEKLLTELLQSDRYNRMAFEYLMGYYLLSPELEKVALNIERLDDFDYPEIPMLYEEALVLHQYRTGRSVALEGRRISPQTLDRFRRFRELVSRRVIGDRSARDALAKEFRGTYFLHLLFGESGQRE